MVEDDDGMELEFDLEQMTPYFNIWFKYGTTLPDLLRQKNIDPYKIND